ncbi:MAG: hypothetical protein Q9191_000444 [Dirinaria sp. TL-2023a]
MSELQSIKTQADFDSQISSLPPTTLFVLSFHTPWAAPCAQQTLILRTLASAYPPQTPPLITFLSIDAEALPDISESFEVTAVPYLVLQRAGQILETVSGSDAAKVRAAVERHAGKGGNAGKLGLPPALETTPRAEEGGGGMGDVEPNGGAATNGENSNGEKPAAGTNNLSKYAPSASDPATAPEMSSTQGEQEELDKRISELVKAAPVMLFMKGTPSTPQCGFSRQLVSILRERGVRYGFFNILADEEIRQGLKKWADWPTYPQLWCGGELVGGLDIVKEELESDPDFFSEYVAAGKGKGGMAAPEAQAQPA